MRLYCVTANIRWIDTPFGTQSVPYAINDLGSITGISYTDPFGPFTSFILSHEHLFAVSISGLNL